jgi:exopolysaccharide biosynthesis protein
MECYMRYSMIIYDSVTVYSMIKGTVKYYEKETKTGKKAGQLSLKDAFASVLPFKNAEELYAEYDQEKKTLTIREL